MQLYPQTWLDIYWRQTLPQPIQPGQGFNGSPFAGLGGPTGNSIINPAAFTQQPKRRR